MVFNKTQLRESNALTIQSRSGQHQQSICGRQLLGIIFGNIIAIGIGTLVLQYYSLRQYIVIVNAMKNHDIAAILP